VPNRPYRRAYDHRIRDLVCEEREPALFAQLGVPRSTTASWSRRGSRPVVTTELFAQDEQALRARVLKLECRVQRLLGIVRLLFVLVRLFGFRLDSQRVSSGEAKSTILGAIVRANKRLPVTVVLRVLGLSASRYHAWFRLEQSCSLDDRSSCPRAVPSQLTRQEVPDQLADATRLARQARLETNRDLSCAACRSPTTAVGPSEAVPSAEREPQ
jgi:putative transposase